LEVCLVIRAQQILNAAMQGLNQFCPIPYAYIEGSHEIEGKIKEGTCYELGQKFIILTITMAMLVYCQVGTRILRENRHS
jgi:hypothetical protein